MSSIQVDGSSTNLRGRATSDRVCQSTMATSKMDINMDKGLSCSIMEIAMKVCTPTVNLKARGLMHGQMDQSIRVNSKMACDTGMVFGSMGHKNTKDPTSMIREMVKGATIDQVVVATKDLLLRI